MNRNKFTKFTVSWTVLFFFLSLTLYLFFPITSLFFLLLLLLCELFIIQVEWQFFHLCVLREMSRNMYTMSLLHEMCPHPHCSKCKIAKPAKEESSMQVECTNKASPKMDHQTDLMPEAKAFALYSLNSRFLYSFFSLQQMFYCFFLFL